MPSFPEAVFEPWPGSAPDNGHPESASSVASRSRGFEWPDLATSVLEDPELESQPEEPSPVETDEAMERRVSEAYEAGRSAGLAEGRAEGEAAERMRLRNAFAALEAALDAIEHGEARWREALEENLVALAIAIAKQVLERETSLDRGIVEDLVRRAAREFPVDQPVRVRLAPADLAALSEAGATPALADLVDGREARWVPDPLLTPGGCVVEGRERIIDGRVDSALERIYRRLTNATA